MLVSCCVNAWKNVGSCRNSDDRDFVDAVSKLLTIMGRAMSCEKSSQLVSDALDRDLSRGERFTIWMHQLMCWPCRHFAKQLEFLNAALSRRADEESSEEGVPVAEGPVAEGLSSDAKRRIADAIRQDL